MENEDILGTLSGNGFIMNLLFVYYLLSLSYKISFTL